MKAVFINDIKRLREKKGKLILIIVCFFVATWLAFFMSERPIKIAHIAYVTIEKEKPAVSPFLDVTFVRVKPKMSSLANGTYDAILYSDNKKKLKIASFKSSKIQNQILTLSAQPNLTKLSKEMRKRSQLSFIIGFLILFVMIAGLQLSFPFTEDHTEGRRQRIKSSSLSDREYLLGHFFFSFTLLFSVMSLTFFLLLLASKNTIHVSLFLYLSLFALLALLAVSFGLFLSVLLKKDDTINMLGSTTLLLTTLLSGSIYEIKNDTFVFQKIISLLPQKQLMNVVDSVNGQQFSAKSIRSVLFVGLWIVFFLVGNSTLEKWDENKK